MPVSGLWFSHITLYQVLMKLNFSLGWLYSLKWRNSSSRNSGKHLARQGTPDRHRKVFSRLHLLVLSICSCIFPLYLLARSESFSSWQNTPYPEQQTSSFPSVADRIIGGNLFKRSLSGCDIYSGTWVHDDTPPLYNSTTCPFAEVGFSCQDNGRPDSDYLKWRWKPFDCEIPLFNAKDIRQKLWDRRIAFIGDSMGRTQWESFICMLMADINNKSSVYEVRGRPITKLSPHLAVRFDDYNFVVEYYRSPYLIREGPPPKHVPKRVQTTLKLDMLERSEKEWLHADILIFNTGHWWTISKTFARGCYFQIDKSIKLGLSLEGAYRIALTTWANWVKSKVDPNKTQVFFRSYEPAHWDGDWRDRLCRLETRPVLNMTYTEDFPHLAVLNEVIQRANVPVTVLNITSMSAYRRDSHVANWTRDGNVVDCGHWCLPGLPDSWNRLLYSALLQRGRGPWA